MKNSYLIVFLVVALLLSACSIKDFQAPEFDKKISLPLLDERYYASDIADTTDDYIIAVGNDSMEFSITEDIETQKVGDALKIEIEPQTYIEKLGKIKVDSTGTAQANVDISTVTGTIEGSPVPPMYDLPPLSTVFTPFSNQNIEYVVIDSGYAYLTVYNGTEIPLSSAYPEHYMTLKICSEGEQVIEYTFEGSLNPYSTITDSVDLSGKTVYATNNTLELTLTTDGTGDEPASINEGDSVTVKFNIGRMQVSEASAKLPEQYEELNEAYSIIDQTGEIQLKEAVIDSCICALNLENTFPSTANISIIFDELFDTSGDNYQFDINIPAHSSTNTSLDLSGFEISSGAILDSLHFQFVINTEPTDGFVEIATTDYVFTSISLGEVKFEKILGIVNNKKIELEDVEEEIDIEDLPENMEGILEFQNVKLIITINNGIDLGCSLYGRLRGYNDDTGDSAAVVIQNEYIQPSGPTAIIIDEGVSELINIIPQRIVGDSLYVIVGGENTITSEDSISGSFTLRTPFEFIIKDKEGIRPDSVEHVEMDEDARETIGDHLNEVTLVLTAENTFPFGARIDVYFATEEDSVYESPDYCVDSLIVIRCESGDEPFTTKLGRDAIEVFTNPDVYIGVELAVQGTDGDSVILRPNDNIHFYGYLTVEGHISESLWED